MTPTWNTHHRWIWRGRGFWTLQSACSWGGFWSGPTRMAAFEAFAFSWIGFWHLRPLVRKWGVPWKVERENWRELLQAELSPSRTRTRERESPFFFFSGGRDPRWVIRRQRRVVGLLLVLFFCLLYNLFVIYSFYSIWFLSFLNRVVCEWN